MVAGHDLGLAAYAAGGRARTVHRSSRLRADRGDRRSGALGATDERTRPTLGGRLEHLVRIGGCCRASRPLNPRTWRAISPGPGPNVECSAWEAARYRLACEWAGATQSQGRDMESTAGYGSPPTVVPDQSAQGPVWISDREKRQVEKANATGRRRSCSSTASGCCPRAGTTGPRSSNRTDTRRHAVLARRS